MINKFAKAYAVIQEYEGGYSMDALDYGKETYKGISRRFNSDWEGWQTIDEYKVKENFPNNLNNAPKLKDMVKALYKRKYWDIFLGDFLPDDIATEMFDISVNISPHKSVKWLQQALNILNRNGILYQDIEEDGKFGEITFRTLKLFIEKDGNVDLISKILNIKQGNHYINVMKKNPTQERFARGWLKRAIIKEQG
jgi:lysozyme family protein